MRKMKWILLLGSGSVLWGGNCVTQSWVAQSLDFLIAALLSGAIPGLTT